MIGYRVRQRQLEKEIDAVSPTWRQRATDGSQPGWSDVKDVWMKLQHYKCGYCERWMPVPQRNPASDGAGGDGDGSRWGGRREYDVEHFRPKGSARIWPAPGIPTFRYDFATGAALPGGYPWLAYNPLNYLASCKTCNQDNKKDFFPIAGPRGAAGASVRDLQRSEKPFLIQPVGTTDDKPENLISFAGYKAVPAASRGHRWRRARVTIDFFGLNLKDDLIYQRCALIVAMWPYLEQRRSGGAAQRQVAEEEIVAMKAPSFAHTNCATCFERVYLEDPNTARSYYDEARSRSRDLSRLLAGG